MNLNDIQREKDLREITFAELFYEIFDEKDGLEKAWSIINRLDPEFKDEQKDRFEQAAKRGKEITKREVEAGFESIRGKGPWGLIHKLDQAEHEGRDFFGDLCDSAREKGILNSLRNALSEKKILEALSILPHMKSDQDLIVFFGNNFHVTLENVNAYTGLLYAFEFFEFDGNDLEEMAFPEDEDDEDED